MTKKKPNKGEYDYPTYRRNCVIIMTIAFFALALAIFLIGYIITKTKENLLTVVAVFVCLPSCKSLVSAIMYCRIPKFSNEVYESIKKKVNKIEVLYSLYLTSYKYNFPINAFAVRGNNLIGFTEFDSCKCAECEAHIKDILSQNAIKNITIKIFTDLKKYEDRIVQIQEMEEGKQDLEILQILKDISL